MFIKYTDETFTISYKVYSSQGKVLSNSLVSLINAYPSNDPTELPTGIFPDLRRFPAIYSDGAGVVEFKDIKVFLLFFLENLLIFY